MRRWPVLLAALLFLLSGCAPQARELDGMALVRVLGVDGGEEVTIWHAEISGNGAQTSAGHFHWY